jgi:hypothetical protein
MIRTIKGSTLKTKGVGSDSASSNSTAMTILTTLLIPQGDIRAGIVNTDSIILRTLLRKGTGFASTYTVTVYWNTSASLTGAVQLATLDVLGTWSAPHIYRTMKSDVILGSDRIKTYSSTTSTQTDLGDLAASMSTITGVDFTVDSYFIVAAIRTSLERTPDSITCSYLTIEI